MNNERLEILMRPLNLLLAGPTGQILAWNVIISLLEDGLRAMEFRPTALSGVAWGAKGLLTATAIGEMITPAGDLAQLLLGLKGSGALQVIQP